jgi:hypothetical protein
MSIRINFESVRLQFVEWHSIEAYKVLSEMNGADRQTHSRQFHTYNAEYNLSCCWGNRILNSPCSSRRRNNSVQMALKLSLTFFRTLHPLVFLRVCDVKCAVIFL